MKIFLSIIVSILLISGMLFSQGANAAQNSGKTPAQATAILNKLIQQHSGGTGANHDVQSSCTPNPYNPNSCDKFLKTCKKHGGGVSTEPGGYGCHVVLPSVKNGKNKFKPLN